MQFTLKEIADALNGTIFGDSETIITKPAKIEEATKGTITFASNPKYFDLIEDSQAEAFVVPSSYEIKDSSINFIKVEDIYSSLSTLLNLFSNNDIVSGVSDNAVVDNSAAIGEGVSIGHYSVVSKNVIVAENAIIYPNVYIGDNVKIGKGSILHSGVKIYKDCVIGDNCIIHSNTVIGSDGFGFAPQPDGTFRKIPQIGIVKIGSHVEIGANCSIDRAAMGETLIEDGVKLDNLIHIAHNVQIGENTVIAAQSGIAGSTSLGHNCMVGGQVGIVGHLKIAGKTQFQAKSGMTKSVKKEGTKWYGYPAIEYTNYLRSFAHFKNLEKLEARVKELESLIENNSHK